MEKCTWKATLLPGKKAEYIRRHDALWPEMAETLRQAGIRNYTIWCCGDRALRLLRVRARRGLRRQGAGGEPVVARWNEYMRDVMRMEFDPNTGTAVALEPVFAFRVGEEDGPCS